MNKEQKKRLYNLSSATGKGVTILMLEFYHYNQFYDSEVVVDFLTDYYLGGDTYEKSM